MNYLYAISVTLLIAVVAIFPAAIVGQYLPGVFQPALRPIAVAAWLSGIISWFVARAVVRKEQEAMQEAVKQANSTPRGVALVAVVLVLAVGVVAALHFFGDGLI